MFTGTLPIKMKIINLTSSKHTSSRPDVEPKQSNTVTTRLITNKASIYITLLSKVGFIFDSIYCLFIELSTKRFQP